jgi:Icc-related predicted phosphoesterase
VTHHPPCGQSIHPKDRGDIRGPALASNLESLIMTFQPTLWISGHTHYCCDYTLNRTRLVSNPRGYSDKDDTGGFKPDRVVEV